MGKCTGNRKKNGLPVFDSDADFLKEFEKKKDKPVVENRTGTNSAEEKNRHGMPVLASNGSDAGESQEEGLDFGSLLDESFRKKTPEKIPKRKSLPIKKRLKRYPPVEADLDLHGFTAMGAQIKAKSFINTCKQQGIFTIRIIVGRGLHSDLGPVLPDVVEDVVRELKQKDIVLSYKWEKKKKSRSGALIVYLKQFDQYD